VDHSSELPAQSPWRNAAFVAATVATVELAILLVVGIFLFGKFFAGEVEKATDPVTVAREAVERVREAAPAGSGAGGGAAEPELLPKRQTSVLVLNGNGQSGAAAVMAERVRGKKYLIAGTGNAPRTDFRRSLVMYRPGFRGEAKRLASDLGIRRVSPLDGLRARDLQGAHLAFVVGG
jgi:hypothetical protein